ncbi:hypothetical protein [Paraburkholderia sp. RL17-373-BIF-A]|uniref:hypothetical protein n=1 Tax=Paraburkholderia sp. RL17-373-BIF-A TaxID=3031629 RepID=UPI0038B6D6BA
MPACLLVVSTGGSEGWSPIRARIDPAFGKTILNSDNSESANAGSLEYRRGLWRNVDVTASYIHEGGKIQSRRDGIAAQFWATRALFDDELSFCRCLKVDR